MDDEFELFVKDLKSKGTINFTMSESEQLKRAMQEIDRLSKLREDDKTKYENHVQSMLMDYQKREAATKAEWIAKEKEMQKQGAHQNAAIRAEKDRLAELERRNREQQNGGNEFQHELTRTLVAITQRLEQNTSNVVLPASTDSISEFDGSEGPDRAGAWIRELENMKNINNWSDAVAYSVAKSRLRKGAFKWFMTKTATVISFESFVREFKSTFTRARTISTKLKQMAARCQGPKEPVQVYFLDKVWLCEGLNLSLDEIRNEVAQELWSREMANYAIGRRYEGTDDLLHDLVQFESMDSSRRERMSELKNQMASVPGRKRGEEVTFPRRLMVEGPKNDEKSFVRSGKLRK